MYACYSIFNESEAKEDAEVLADSIKSVVPFVEKVIAIDGPYKSYPHISASSNDRTKQIFQEFCGDKLTWVEKQSAWSTQVAKRNEYLKLVLDGSWFLVIDGDEVGEGDVQGCFEFAEKSQFNCISVRIRNHVPIHPSVKIKLLSGHPHIFSNISRNEWPGLKWRPYYGFGTRLYRKLLGMEYRGHHSTIFIGSKLISRAQAQFKRFCLVNKNYVGTWERWNMKQSYKHYRLRSGTIDA